jgi:hypothetical protein
MRLPFVLVGVINKIQRKVQGNQLVPEGEKDLDGPVVGLPMVRAGVGPCFLMGSRKERKKDEETR